MSANLFELLQARAPRLDKPALESEGGRSLSYGELFAASGRAARALVDLGVEPGDRVAAQIDKSPEAIVLALACFRAGTVGFALPGVSLRIADPESGAALADGEAGVIEVKGPNVFKGYWRMPEKTAAEFRPDGYFITGDIGKIDARGYLHIVGRAKDLIISGGFNVYPKEIEGEIDAIPGVVESAVIGLAHPDFGEGVTAVVVAQTGAGLDEAAILAAIGGRLARYKAPKRVIFVDELPRNAMGKVQKAALREAYRGLYAP